MVIDSSDMDRYLRERKRRAVSAPSDDKPWWSSMFAKKPVDEGLTQMETHKLEAMEHELEEGEHKAHAAHLEDEHLADEQEERVSFYQRMRRIFSQEHKLEDEYEHLEAAKQQVPDANVTEDFRTMAQIQVRWLERLPTRIKEEFKSSDDYLKLREVLQRRGVAKK